MRPLRHRPGITAALVVLALVLFSPSITSGLAGGAVIPNSLQGTLSISGQVTETNGTPAPNVTMTVTTNRMGVIETRTTQTDATSGSVN